METREHTFLVTISVQASHDDTRKYIEDALRQWGSQYPPDNPFFADNKKVMVTRSYRPRR